MFIFISSVVQKYIDEALININDEKNKHSVLAKMIQAEDASKKDIFTMISDMFMAGIDTVRLYLAFNYYQNLIFLIKSHTINLLYCDYPISKNI